ncbi:MAG TPA: DoxX family protein [Xanthobacteraceae bacterium]|nr:DoxX family protein [Xanthobacteraceae bacterium]
MSIVFLLGRIAFVAVFIISGIFTLLDRVPTALLIESKFRIPASLGEIAIEAQNATGLAPYELLATVVACIQIGFAALIIFNILTRFSSLVLLVFTLVATYFLYDFWNMTGDARALNLVLALQNLSIAGGLVMLFVLGSWQPPIPNDDYDLV